MPLLPPPSLPGYNRHEQLGAGQYGIVFRATEVTTGTTVAVKYTRVEALTALVRRELRALHALRHPRIVALHRVELVPPDHLAILTELVESAPGAPPGQTLIDFVRMQPNFFASEAQSRAILAQILEALRHCHSLGIVHRDLKCDNVLLASVAPPGGVPAVKVCDFGFAKNMNVDSTPNTGLGTSYYMSPEVYASLQHGTRYDGYAADVWACGVLLLTLLRGAYPFQGAGDSMNAALIEGQRLALQGQLQPRLVQLVHELPHNNVSPDCRRVLCSMLAAEQTARPSPAALLTDPWFIAGVADVPPPPPLAPPPQQTIAQLEVLLEQLEVQLGA